MQYSRDQRVHVQLRVEKSLLEFPGNPSDYYVAVSGTGLQLGNNNPEIAPRCQLDRHNVWVKDIWPPKNSHVDFRFLVVHRFSNTVKAVEDVVTRRLFVGDVPIVVEASFDKPGFSVTNENKFTSFNMKLNTLNRRQTRYTGPRISEKPKPMPKKYNTMTFATDNTKDGQKYINNTWNSQNMKEHPRNIQLKNKELEQEIEAKREGLVRLKIKEESRLLESSGKQCRTQECAEESVKLRMKQDEDFRKLLHQRKDESRQVKTPVEECSMPTTQGKEYEKDRDRATQECPNLTQNYCQDEHKQEKQMKQEYDNTKDKLAKETADIIEKLDEEVYENDETKENNVKSTTNTMFPHRGKRYVLMAAGVAVVIGCIAFIKK